jgi:tRNA-dihydrouridine synthase
MSRYHPDLVADINAFLEKHPMSEVTFGRKAMGDPHFVRDVKATRLLRPETLERVRAFMEGFAAETPSTPAESAAA